METGKLNSLAGNSIMKTLFDSLLGARPAVVSRGYRVANMERLRIFAASAIVFFHMCSDLPIARHLGTVGILVFLISFSAFVVNRPKPLDLESTVRRKAQRLLKPWLFWSVVYSVVVLAKVLYKNVPLSDAFQWTMLLTGSRIHLWFLPFAFVIAILLVLIHRAVADIPAIFTIVIAILAGALCVLGCSIIQSFTQPPTPLRQWILGTPAIFLGLAVGQITLQRRAEDRRNLYLFAVLSMAAVCAVHVWIFNGLWADYAAKFAVRYFASVTLVCFALHWQGNLDQISRKLASLSYGVYLVHPLVLVFLCELNIGVQHPLASLVVVLVISAGTAHILRKIPFMRQFI
jgi:peptidoglycan/LPS O-acetylase OafA/YrhL